MWSSSQYSRYKHEDCWWNSSSSSVAFIHPKITLPDPPQKKEKRKIMTQVNTRLASVFQMTGGASVLTEVMESGEKAAHRELLLCLLWKHRWALSIHEHGKERERGGETLTPGSVRCLPFGWKTDWSAGVHTDRTGPLGLTRRTRSTATPSWPLAEMTYS